MFFYGDFTLISAANLLQLLCREQRSATVSAWRGHSQALVELQAGLLVAARCDHLLAEAALYRLLAWDSGQFQVTLRATPPADKQMALAWDEVAASAALWRDELAHSLTPLPAPLPRQRVESLLAACPAVLGVALVGYDGRVLAQAGLSKALLARASVLAAGLGAVSDALSLAAGRDPDERLPVRVSIYADQNPTVLLAEWGSATRLLAELAPAAQVEDAIRQLRLQVTMVVSSPL
jgi:hypothetical protein